MMEAGPLFLVEPGVFESCLMEAGSSWHDGRFPSYNTRPIAPSMAWVVAGDRADRLVAMPIRFR